MERPNCPDCNSSNIVKKGHNCKNQQRYYCKSCNINFYDEIEIDNDIVISTQKLARRNQYLTDKQRIDNKSWRENARLYNVMELLSSELKSTIAQHDNSNFPIILNNEYDNAVGIIQLSDLHFGELIQIDCNEYNFTVASKRLYKFVEKSIEYFKINKVNHVVLAMTGDLFNSNRRIDEITSQAASRANSLFIGTKLIENVILHLSKNFDITVANISGNESRIEKDWSYVDSMVSDNFDFMLFNILRYKFEKVDRINFIFGNPCELVINVNDNNILLLHGNSIGSNTTNEIQKIRGKYSAKNVHIDYVLFGHLHQAYISDLFSRSSSLCGANAYSERGLNLSSRASQNIFIVHGNKEIDCIKIDLQNTENVKNYYNIDDTLIEYETKSIEKLNAGNNKIIMQIVV